MTPPPVGSRRARRRAQTVADITAEAQRQLAERGAAGVSWRGIAAAVGLDPASLYTYFDNLDALVTRLLVDNYASLAAAVAEATDAVPATAPRRRVEAGVQAYRRWALDHRAAFNLVFTDQVPGYAAPPDGPTTEAQIAVLRPIATALAELLGADPDELGRPGPLLDTFLALWAQVHGLTSLEVNHHLDWTPRDALFRRTVAQHLDQLTPA